MKNIDKETLKRCGFREDFDWDTRFDLKTEVNGYVVSTVDLGIDHSWGIGEPLYYETIIFKKDGEGILYCERYSTQEEAEKGHKKVVKMVEEGRIN